MVYLQVQRDVQPPSLGWGPRRGADEAVEKRIWRCKVDMVFAGEPPSRGCSSPFMASVVTIGRTDMVVCVCWSRERRLLRR